MALSLSGLVRDGTPPAATRGRRRCIIPFAVSTFSPYAAGFGKRQGQRTVRRDVQNRRGARKLLLRTGGNVTVMLVALVALNL